MMEGLFGTLVIVGVVGIIVYVTLSAALRE